jgi:hypothetical protein
MLEVINVLKNMQKLRGEVNCTNHNGMIPKFFKNPDWSTEELQLREQQCV